MRIVRSIITVFVCVFVLLTTALFFILPKNDFLESENRKAATLPSFDMQSLADGTYTAGIEEYTKDNFPARELFMKIKTEAQLTVGYREISDTYVGNGRLFQKVKNPDETKFVNGVKRIRENVDPQRVTVSVMLLPTSSFVHSEDMPEYAPKLDQKSIIDDILEKTECENPLNLCDVLVKAKSGSLNNVDTDNNGTESGDGESVDMFYVCDHHWTTYAAYTAYTAFCESRSLAHGTLWDYDMTVVSDSFRGTLFSRVPSTRFRADKIVRFDRKSSDSFVSFDSVDLLDSGDSVDSGTNTEAPCGFKAFYADSVSDILEENYTEYSYYREEALDKKDKYTYFGGDNYPLVILKNENAATTREIVVAKDSFANSFVPFLTENFSTVYVLDERYLRGKSVSDFANENENVTDVLILYGLNSLNDNSGIALLG